MKIADGSRWLRVVLVTDWALWTMVGSVLAVWLLQRLMALWLYLFAASDLTEAELRLSNAPIHVIFALFLAFAYGIIRASVFHPILNKPYGRWLATTPWKYPEPLPLGPIRLVWQDAAVLAILLLLSLLPPWSEDLLFAAIPLVFLAGDCLPLAAALYQLEAYWASIVYALLVGCAFLAMLYPPTFVLVALAMVGVSRLAIRGLRDFPYTLDRREALGLTDAEKQTAAEVYLTIAPQADDALLDLMNPRRAAVLALTAGWLMFSGATLFFPEVGLRGLWLMHFGVCLVVITARLFVYTMYRLPPISLPGRFATSSYRIPGYDPVFFAPLAAATAALLLPALLLGIGLWPTLAIAISTSAAIWLALALPPSFKDWYYTGHFRMLPPNVSQQKQPRVRAGS